jgi:crotonobetainyl-CoA:carnitine CoA-transferase CaiB-like acyl-CoA transferase
VTKLPLDGIRVVDLSRVLAGPFCGALLGDLGADVVKVEEPGSGDEGRSWAPQRDGESPGFLVNNRNKRGIAVDLKQPEGVEIVRRLASRADVLVENFRSGAMEAFGLGYESLAAANPRLVYASVSAFGRTGPRANEAGYEAVMQAFGGIMSITGEEGGAPVRCGASFVDLATGILCALGVLAALPMGDTHQHTPAVMLNLLGDIWFRGDTDTASEPDWTAILSQPQAKLHLYGKREPRRGRKMGHVTCLGASVDAALATASTIRRDLGIPEK